MNAVQMTLEKLNVLEYIVTEKFDLEEEDIVKYTEEYNAKFEAYLAELTAEANPTIVPEVQEYLAKEKSGD